MQVTIFNLVFFLPFHLIIGEQSSEHALWSNDYTFEFVIQKKKKKLKSKIKFNNLNYQFRIPRYSILVWLLTIVCMYKSFLTVCSEVL